MDPEDFKDKTLEDFQLNNNVPLEIIQLRYNHFQNKRRSKWLWQIISIEHIEMLARAMGLLDAKGHVHVPSRWKPF